MLASAYLIGQRRTCSRFHSILNVEPGSSTHNFHIRAKPRYRRIATKAAKQRTQPDPGCDSQNLELPIGQISLTRRPSTRQSAREISSQSTARNKSIMDQKRNSALHVLTLSPTSTRTMSINEQHLGNQTLYPFRGDSLR